MYLFGEAEDIFLKLSPDDVFTDLILLYARMIELGFEYRNDEVYLEDLNGKL